MHLAKPIQPISTPIHRITLVDEIERLECMSFHSESLPGHLIHIVESGEVHQEAEGRHEAFLEGKAVWYHENEPIRGTIVRAPWRFITINFEAPELAPPPDHQRILRAGPRTLALARRLLSLWRNSKLPALERDLRTHATLLELILKIHPLDTAPASGAIYPTNARDSWWAAEKKLRNMLNRPLSLEVISTVAGMSVRTTIRACKAATGLPPGRRIHQLRLAYATSLLQHSRLSITEIAARVGYSRVQEFSRDYRKQNAISPSAARARHPDYLEFRHCPMGTTGPGQSTDCSLLQEG